MVEIYKKEHYLGILEFIQNNKEPSFYIVDGDNKILINSEKIWNKVFRKHKNIFLISDKGDVFGLGFLYKSKHDGTDKTYIKFNVSNKSILYQILTVILWNNRRLLYILINNRSPYISVLKQLQFYPKEYKSDEILFEYNPLIYKEKK